MKGSFVVILACARILVAALPSLNSGVSKKPGTGANLIEELVARLPSLNSGLSERDPERNPVLLEARGAGLTWSKPGYCTAETASGGFHDIYTALLAPSNSFDYSSFCSKVVQSYTIEAAYTTASGVKTETLTSTTTTSTSTTSTDKSSGTTTLLCPTPSLSMTCGIKANGYSENLLDTDWTMDTAQCHQWCLSRSDCKSFQTIPQDNGISKWNSCNLWNVTVAGNVDSQGPTIVATFYDRDCGDLLPTGCTPASAMITPAPTVPPRALERRAEYSLPDFLLTKGETLILLAPVCSCLISAAPPDWTLTQTNLIQTWTSVTVTTVKTEHYTYTAHPHLKSVYTSIN